MILFEELASSGSHNNVSKFESQISAIWISSNQYFYVIIYKITILSYSTTIILTLKTYQSRFCVHLHETLQAARRVDYVYVFLYLSSYQHTVPTSSRKLSMKADVTKNWNRYLDCKTQRQPAMRLVAPLLTQRQLDNLIKLKVYWQNLKWVIHLFEQWYNTCRRGFIYNYLTYLSIESKKIYLTNIYMYI